MLAKLKSLVAGAKDLVSGQFAKAASAIADLAASLANRAAAAADLGRILDIIDMVWTTGVGNNAGLINLGADTMEYNATSARYSYLHELTGKTIFVDTSFGPSQQADSWSNNTADVLNDRIAEGVIAANVTQPPTDYQTRVTTLAPNLDSTCQ